MRTFYRYLMVVAVLISCYDSTIFSQPISRPFPFTIPLNGINQTEFNSPPLKPISRISIKDGHFATADGKRARFIGASFYYTACYPDSADAISIAKRLGSLGFNAVRFNAYDLRNWNESTFLAPGNSSDALSPEQMKRIDWFIYQLSLNGIYIYLPILSEWLPRQDDGIAKWDSLPRYISFIEPDFLPKHKQVIRMLMNHINPYTQNAWKDEPAIAFMDLTYENSLIYQWQNGNLLYPKQYGLSSYNVKRLDSLFSLILQSKYGNDLALKKAWESLPASSANILMNGGFEDAADPTTNWQLSVNEQAKSVLLTSDGNKVEGERSANVKVSQTSGLSYAVQFINQTAKLVKYRDYELRFSAKTTAAVGKRPFIVVAQRGMQPYEVYGLYQQDTVTANWKEYVIPFRANTTDSSTVNLSFYLGQATGDFFLDNVQLREATTQGLMSNESMANFSVKRSSWYDNSINIQRMADNAIFYTGLVKNYTDQMYSFLKDSIGTKALISGGTQTELLNDLFAIKNTDFTNEFGGWDGADQKGGIQYIQNAGMTSSPYAAAFPEYARAKIKDKPFLISGFLMAYPAANQNEMLTMLPAYSAYQDWDGFFLTYYNDSRYTFNNNYIDSTAAYQLKNSTFLSMMPQAAKAFYSGAIAPAKRTINLKYTTNNLLTPQWQLYRPHWLEINTDQRMLLFRKIQIDSFDAEEQTEQPHRTIAELSSDNGVDIKDMISDTEELLWNAADSFFTVNTPRYISATGSIGGKILRFTPDKVDVRVERLDAGSVGSFSWISEDSLPVTKSRKSLLTLSSRAVNSGAVWQLKNALTIWGKGPMQTEAMTIRFAFESGYDSIRITPLDSAGNRIANQIPITKMSGRQYTFDIDQDKVNSIWFIVEQLGINGIAEESTDEFTLNTLYSSYDQSSCRAIATFPQSGNAAALTITNGLGIETMLWHGTANGQTEQINIPVTFASGIYLLKAETSGKMVTHKFMIVR
ncbi:MAG: carbohydrate binding domain-containing protein [Ignavibacteriae bacterium]|nr:carbohydrate binding domain-containing protein [Ignavibacteriota bacterium]